MYTENCIEYIKTGLGLAPDRKLHIKMSSGPLLMAFTLGLLPGIVLNGAWLVLSMTMLSITVAAFIAVTVISSTGMTVKNRLILQVIIYSSFILAFCFVDVMYYAVVYGFNAVVVIIFIPSVITPVLLGIMMSRRINKDTPFTPKQMTKSTLKAGGIGLGIASMNFAALAFKGIDQETAIIIVLVLTAFLNVAMSVGLLSIQRLYYLSKLNKEGIFIE